MPATAVGRFTLPLAFYIGVLTHLNVKQWRQVLRQLAQSGKLHADVNDGSQSNNDRCMHRHRGFSQFEQYFLSSAMSTADQGFHPSRTRRTGDPARLGRVPLYGYLHLFYP
jgi:hypothetical protein